MGPLCPTIMHSFRLAGRKLPTKWSSTMGKQRNQKKHLNELFRSAPYSQWLEAYDAFVRVVVLPVMDDPQGIYYQRPPTLRVAMPAQVATIGIHCDSDYHGHHPAEVNFWVPLVDVSGGNALWLESEPGGGDFSPRPLAIGQVLRFNGNLCRHHTVPNDTDRTRVSFDLRAIQASAITGQPPTTMGDYGVAFMK